MLLQATVAALAYSSSGPRLAVLQHSVAQVPRCEALFMQDDGNTLKCDVRALPQSAIALDITVPAKVANEIHLKTLAGLAKKAKIPGFRDGKVPPQAVVAKLGIQKVKEATVEQIIDVGMTQSGVGQKIHTVGEARLPEEIENLAGRYTVGESISFSVEVDVMPQVPVEESMYKGLKVQIEKEEFNQDAYDSALLKLRKQYADVVDVGEGVASVEGNQLVVNMNGFLAQDDGSKGEQLPAVAGGDGITVPLETGKFMPGLVEGLVGVKAGETRDVQVSFPARTSAPQLAGKSAIFEVECLAVQERRMSELTDEFASRVKSDMTFAELDEKLKEGVQQDADDKLKGKTNAALERALVNALPAEFEVPETLIEDVSKERFAMMLSDMKERGSTDEQLKELITQENYERYKKIQRPMAMNSIKGNFAIRAVGKQQGLTVPQSEVDDEVMTLQAKAVQQGEKFKESEVRPRVEQQLEKNLILSWLESQGEVAIVDELDVDAEELLGQSPEELAKAMIEEEAAAGNAEPAAASGTEAGDGPKATTGSAPDGYEWGTTY
jgi:trigger factor